MKTSVAVARALINGCKQLCGKVRTGTEPPYRRIAD